LRPRYLAFWEKRVADEAIIAHIQNPTRQRLAPEAWMLAAGEEKYLDPEKLYRLQNWRRSGWSWHTDLFKYRIASYGPNVFAGFCGGTPVFGADTVWHEPMITSLDEADRVHFTESNRYWQAHVATVDWFARACRGEEQFGVTDFGGPTDWISQLMGTENSLIATVEEPERMREFALRLVTECCQAYDLIYPRATAYNDGTVNWMPVWSDRRMGTVQDDMAINFSPAMYAEVFLPAIRHMAAHTEHTVLHWHDGASQHLDALLQLDEIHVVQYGHDPNSPPFRAALPAMQKIQAAGKRLFISCVEAEDVEFFIDRLDPRGLFMIIDTVSDEDSRQMEENVHRWTARRLRTASM
jgi:hypothetical protein